MKTRRSQTGLALMVLVFLIALMILAYTVKYLDGVDLKLERDHKTSLALAQAKAGLLSFSAKDITADPLSPALTCRDNCPRPGDLPCPDTDNDGEAETICNTQASRLGRLPWKTLGLGDIRDGSGERLWYAVSNQYKNNPRVLPLNSESLGAITLKNAQGDTVYDASASAGLVAVVIAPNAVLTRSGSATPQDRASVAQQNIATNYLDIAYGDDNADFIDLGVGANGFVNGEVKVGEVAILNDVILPITRDEMNAVIEPRVLAEVMEALLINTCPAGFDIENRTCTTSPPYNPVPDPASVADPTCITASPLNDVPNGNCNTDNTVSEGRFPVTIALPTTGWESKNANSILRGESAHNWFQQNNWRELIFYAVAPACTPLINNCGGATGTYLALENALTPFTTPNANNKGVVVFSASAALSTQPRSSIGGDYILANYLEFQMEDGTPPPLYTYSRYTHNSTRNDRVISIP